MQASTKIDLLPWKLVDLSFMGISVEEFNSFPMEVGVDGSFDGWM